VKAGGSQVVFIGDSITHGWETTGSGKWYKYFKKSPFKALNLGYSADRTEHVLWRLNNGELDGYEAKAIVLMIGTNNTGHFSEKDEPPCDTILGIREIIRKIREKQHKARLILLPIFPRGAAADDSLRMRNEVVNREIMKYANGRSPVWLDFTDRFLLADGTLPRDVMPDLLHLGSFAYEVWGCELLEYLDCACAGQKTPGGRFCMPLKPVPYCNADTPLAAVPSGRFYSYSSRWGSDWWANKLLRNRRQIASSGGKIDIVLMGDSITHFMEIPEPKYGGSIYASFTNRYSVLNCGYAGDSTRNLLWRAMYGELDGYTAKTVVIMIGTNNPHTSGYRGPDETVAGITRIVEVVRRKQPNAKVLLYGIFPRGKSGDPKRADNEKVNEKIQKLANGKNIFYVDIGARLVDEKGNVPKEIASDLLHPTEKGYKIWLPSIEEQISSMK
jgi:lysophospholipase L1-like esterase